MTILPPPIFWIRIFPGFSNFFIWRSTRSKYTWLSSLSPSWAFLLYVSWYSQKRRKAFEQFGLQDTNICGGKYTSAHPLLARKYTNRKFESKDGTARMTYYIRLKTPDFYLNDLLIKSNRTGLQAYTAEERTFGTPCISLITTQMYVFKLYMTESLYTPCKFISTISHGYHHYFVQ